MRFYKGHKASPDVVVYHRGDEKGTPIAIYECKLYKNSKASKDNMHQVESQIAAFFDDPRECSHYGLIYGHFDGKMPDAEPNVYHIDLRGAKDDVDKSFKATLELLRNVVLRADWPTEAREDATQPGPATI